MEWRRVDEHGAETARVEYWGEAMPAMLGIGEGDVIAFNGFGQERKWRVTRVDRSNMPASIGFDVEPWQETSDGEA